MTTKTQKYSGLTRDGRPTYYIGFAKWQIKASMTVYCMVKSATSQKPQTVSPSIY